MKRAKKSGRMPALPAQPGQPHALFPLGMSDRSVLRAIIGRGFRPQLIEALCDEVRPFVEGVLRGDQHHSGVQAPNSTKAPSRLLKVETILPSAVLIAMLQPRPSSVP